MLNFIVAELQIEVIMNKLMIWDIDGTLIQNAQLGKTAWNKTFFELYGIKDGFENISMAGKLDTAIIKEAYDVHHLIGKNKDAFFDLYCSNLAEDVKNRNSLWAAPGILSLLKTLRTITCFYNSLGTGNIERGARIKLSRDNINEYFAVGGFGDFERERWELIENAITNSSKHFGIEFSKSDIFVIGDTPKDIECGKKLGVKSIGVATGQFSVEQLRDCAADFVFQNLLDNEKFIEVINNV